MAKEQVMTKATGVSREHPFTQVKRSEARPVKNTLVDLMLPIRRAVGNRAFGQLSESFFFQAKFNISQPGDVYEQEADCVADQVLRMPAQATYNEQAGTPRLSRMCDECEGERLQTKQASARGAETSLASESQIVGRLTEGEPLGDEARGFFEPRFGYDFSRVRIHTGAEAAGTARAVNALAYTVGNDIVFGEGRYEPGSAAGRKLLAHELTHVIQQSRNRHAGELPHVQRFTTEEHTDIGNAAYRLVGQDFTAAQLRQSPLFNTLREGSRFRFGEQVRTYGDIVADGDFFEQFEDLIAEHGDRPGRLGLAVLAARNLTHFTPHNIQHWRQIHSAAIEEMLRAYNQMRSIRDFLASVDPLLERAREAALRNDMDLAMRYLALYRHRLEPQREVIPVLARNAHALARQALMRNAFGEHFLTDAFSAGHIVTPRAEILQEVGTRLDQPVSGGAVIRGALLGSTWGELPELRAQARSMAWHDLDNHYGIEVSNDDPGYGPWMACGDNCSQRTEGSHWNATRASVIGAAYESIKHLWDAGLNGVRPSDYNSVTNLVPRPTWRGYPAWGQTEWQNQLRYIRGENTPHIPGDQLTPFAVDLSPIEHCADLEPMCFRPFIGTSRDWITRYSFDSWVRPWITRIQAGAAERYRF